MNWKKLILLSYIAPAVFAISTAMAAQRMMQSAPMHGVHRSSAARTSIMTNSVSGFHRFNGDRFNRFNNAFVFNDRFRRFHRFNDGDFDRDDRFRRFHRFNDIIVFDNFGFPFFPFYYPYPYYPYSYDGYDQYGYDAYQGGYGNGSSVVQLQRRLARAGYYHGAIDGIMGPATRRAMRAYDRDHNQRGYGMTDRY